MRCLDTLPLSFFFFFFLWGGPALTKIVKVPEFYSELAPKPYVRHGVHMHVSNCIYSLWTFLAVNLFCRKNLILLIFYYFLTKV
jgi:hypothetical protein